MANNNVKLDNGPGTSSSGGIKVLDLNTMDDDLFGDLEDIPQRGIVEELKAGFMSGFLGSLDTRRVVTQFVTSAAPVGFSRLFGGYESLMASVGEVKEHVERTNSQDLLFFANKTNSLLPYIKDKIPAGLYDNIGSVLESKIDDYQYATDNNERNTNIRRVRETEERKLENENNLIKEALDHNSLVTRSSFVKQERGEIAREARRTIASSIRDNVERNRFDFMAKSLSMSVDSLTKISAYNEQVDYGMKRKGLELQFRTYLGLKDSIKVQSETYKLLNEGLQAVVRNTALPDHKKKNQKELNRIGSLRGKAGRIGKETLKSLPSWLAGYRGEATDKAKRSIGSTLGNAANAMRMGEMVDLGDMWDQRYSTAGALAGDAVGTTFTDKIVPWAGRKLRPELEKVGDEFLGGRQHQTSYILDNIPALLNEYVSSNKERGFLGNNLKDFLEPLIPRYDRKSTVEAGGYKNLTEMAAFNEITQRSIVDVIPGYLSRILHELRIVRTGDVDLDREVFDITNGKFTGSKIAKSNLLARFISGSNVETTSTATAEAIKVIDPDAKLSEEARSALSERLIRDANTNTRWDPEAYASRYGYGNDVDATVVKEINDLLKAQFKFNQDGDMLPTTENFKTRNAISDRFLDIKSSTTDPAGEILRLVESGNTEMLRDMGILETLHGTDKINYKRIWDILGKNTEDSLVKVREDQTTSDLRDKAKEAVSDVVDGTKTGLSTLWETGKEAVGNPFAKANEAIDSLKERFIKPKESESPWKPKQPKGSLVPSYSDNTSTTFDLPSFKPTVPTITEPKVDYSPKGEKLDLKPSPTKDIDYPAVSGFKGEALDNPYKAINLKMKSLSGRFTEEAKFDTWSPKQPKGPLIKGSEFGEGVVFDYKTGKVVKSPSDITGAVVDENAQFLATKAEVEEGLYTPKGVKLDLSLKADGPLDYQTLKGFKVAPGSDVADTEDIPEVDWFLDDPETPILTVVGLQAGKYFNVKGEVLRSFADVKDVIYDATGTILVSEGALQEGLWNKHNTKRLRIVKRSKLSMLGNVASTYMNTNTSDLIMKGLKSVGKLAVGMGVSAFNTIVSNRDAYFQGSEDPVLTKADMLRGLYYDDKGKVIESFGNVYGNVRDEEGNVLVAKDKLPELINIDGSKHQLARNRSLLGRSIGRASKWYAKKSKQYMKWATKKTLGAYKWGLGKVPFVGKYFKGKHKQGEDALEQFSKQIGKEPQGPTITDRLLNEILGTLKAQVPEKLRVGSWKDQLAKKKSSAETKDNKDDTKTSKMAGLGLLGSLKNMLFGKKDSDDEDSYGASDALRDAAAADSILDRDGKETKGKKPKGKKSKGKPKGKFSKLADRVKKSRIGRSKLGRLAGGVGKLAAGAGRIAVGGAVLLGKGALALAGAITAPVAIGLATAAGVAVGGYYGYKYLKNRGAVKGDIRQLRLLQYGFTSYSEQAKILGLEDMMEPLVSKGPNPTIKMNNAQVGEIFKIFDVDPKGDPDRVSGLIKFFENRFKPIFLRYMGTLDDLNLTNLKINDIDEKMPAKHKLEFVTAVSAEHAVDVFADTVDPFSSKNALLTDTRKAYQSWLNMVMARIKKGAKDDVSVIDSIKDIPPMLSDTGTSKIKTEGKSGPLTNTAILETGSIAQTAAESIGTFSNTIRKAPEDDLGITVINRKLDTLRAIRLRAYGVEKLTPYLTAALGAIEEETLKVLFSSNRAAGGDVSLNLVRSLNLVSSMLGRDRDMSTTEGAATVKWITERFEPSIIGIFKSLQSLGLKDLKSVTKPNDIITLSKRILGGGGSNYWTKDSIFPTPNGLPALRELAKLELAKYEEELKQPPLATNVVSGSAQVDMQLAAKAGKSDSVFESIANTASKAMSSVKEGFSNLWNRMTGDDTGATVAPSRTNPTPSTGNSVNQGGESYGSITEGNGGEWEKIPYPAANRSAKAARPTLEAVSKMTGVPAVLLHIFASMESSFDYSVKAKTSSASGWFQFINKTWDQMIRDHGSKFNLPPDNGRKLRLDPRINALMGAMFLKGNAKHLRSRIGREPNDVDLYCAHFMGAGGASTFLRLNPNTVAATGMPEAAAANRSIYYLPSGRARTVAQVYQLFSDKVAAHRKTFDSSYTEDTKSAADENEVKSTDTTVEETDVTVVDTSDNVVASGGATTPPVAGANETNADTGEFSVSDVAKDPMSSPLPSVPGTTATVPKVRTMSVEEQPANTVTYAPSPAAVSVNPVESNTELDVATRKNALHAQDQQLQNARTLESLEYQRQQLDAVLNLQNNLQIIVDLQQAKTDGGSTTTTNTTSPNPTQTRRAAGLDGTVSLR